MSSSWQSGRAPVYGLVLALAVGATGCTGGASSQAEIGYRHSAADTLRVLVPVCPGEQVTGAQIRLTSDETRPGVGIDIPAEDRTVDFLIGYPQGWTPEAKDLRLTISTSRTTYRDLVIPPNTAPTPSGDDWLRAGTGEPTTRAEIVASATC